MSAASSLRKLEAQRREALGAIRLERSLLEDMVLRAKCNSSPLPTFVEEVRQRLADLEPKVATSENEDDIDDLVEEAESLGHNRAYVCPPHEIADEGGLRIDVMADWGSRALRSTSYANL